MLTDSEKKWLEARKCKCHFCAWRTPELDKNGKVVRLGCFTEGDQGCGLFFYKQYVNDYRDVAEFEARVAALLAEEAAPWSPCYHTGHCPLHVETVSDCMACRLKLARLAAEEEMENGRSE